LQPNSVSEVIKSISQNSIILLYNFLPVLLAVIFFYLITNNIFYTSAFVSILFEIASIINRYKIIYRDDPFVPIDISLWAEAMSITKKTNLNIDLGLLLAVLLPALLLIVIGIFVKSKKINIIFRTVGLILCIIVALVLNNSIYKSKQIYDNLFTSGPQYYVAGNYNSKGFIYCFLYNLNMYDIQVPENYNIQYAEKLKNKYSLSEKKVPLKKPHIIIVMYESFSDITTNENFIFTSEEDPLKNFKKISEKGYLIVPNLSAGTANTEYDVLTGCMTNNLSKTNTSAFRLVNRDFNSLPRFFSSNGYRTLFIHPGDNWFYNRMNVYKYFGINNQIFVDNFRKPQDYKGSLVSDDAVIDKIINEFKDHIKNYKDIPLFSFNVTIQNHMPYEKNKYGAMKIEPVKTKIKISDRASEILSNYIVGIRDADNSMGKLIKYFSQNDEPVVLVLFGDHTPNLGENYYAYKELGYETNQNKIVEGVINYHKVPFAIWANDQAKNNIDFMNSIKGLDLPPDRTISANYLGPMIYELLGYKGVEPFYDFLNSLRRNIPVIAKNYYKTNNRYTAQVPENLITKIQDYKIWQYFKMNNEKLN